MFGEIIEAGYENFSLDSCDKYNMVAAKMICENMFHSWHRFIRFNCVKQYFF